MTLSVGAEIDAWCTSCRMNLNHRIVAMVGGAAKRVLCLTCDKQHNYRSPKSEGAAKVAKKTTKKAPSAKSVAAAATAAQRKWQEATGDKDASEYRPYSMTTRFEAGQLIMHPKFGEGLVQEVTAPQKISILFRTGLKTLIHDRS